MQGRQLFCIIEEVNMLSGFAVIMLSGLLLGRACGKIRFPALFGMIIAGIITGPYVLDLIDESVLNMSAGIRRIALIIILIRAGLKLDVSDLKQVGRPALLMCFVPACLEIAGMIFIAPKLLGVSILEAAILGSVVAAVSPAVVVPRMIRLIDEGYGTQQSIPQMILAGASVDDVFVIVMFSTFTGLAQGADVSFMNIVSVPLSILTGIAAGIIAGFLLVRLFEKIRIDPLIQTVILLSISFLLNDAEGKLAGFPFAPLIAIMCIGTAIRKLDVTTAVRLSGIYDKMWRVAEIFLFVLVGASAAVDSLMSLGVSAVMVLLMAILFRMAGVYLCVLGTKLDLREKLFCMIAYTPKATVQAAIGGLPLAMGLACGQAVLTVSAIAILLTAPLGAFGIDLTYRKLLKHEQ